MKEKYILGQTVYPFLEEEMDFLYIEFTVYWVIKLCLSKANSCVKLGIQQPQSGWVLKSISCRPYMLQARRMLMTSIQKANCRMALNMSKALKRVNPIWYLQTDYTLQQALTNIQSRKKKRWTPLHRTLEVYFEAIDPNPTDKRDAFSLLSSSVSALDASSSADSAECNAAGQERESWGFSFFHMCW